MAVFILILFFALTLIGVPIGFMLGLTALFGFHMLDNPAYLTMLSQRFFFPP